MTKSKSRLLRISLLVFSLSLSGMHDARQWIKKKMNSYPQKIQRMLDEGFAPDCPQITTLQTKMHYCWLLAQEPQFPRIVYTHQTEKNNRVVKVIQQIDEHSAIVHASRSNN